MRLVPALVMLPLLLCASARAEEAKSILDFLTPAAEKPAAPKTQTKPKNARTETAKHVMPTLAPATAETTTDQAAPEKTDVKPAAKAGAPKPATAKTEPVKLPPPRPMEAKAVETKPELPKLGAAKSEAKKPETKTVEIKKPDVATAEPVKTEPPTSDAFAGIPAADRQKVQSALLWSGDYAVAAAGEDPMVPAVKNYQKRSKGKITGVLTETERGNLLAAASNHEQEFGWSVVVDPATGIRIGLPTKLVPQAQEAPRGTRWSSAHGDVQVETFRVADRDLKLAALFEQEKREPATRKIEYSLLRDDGFIISGFQGLKKFSVKAQFRDGEVRGFTMMYDQMMETIVTPVMVAMASAFSPFPERSAPFAALSKSVEYGNGIVVSDQGHIVTDRKLTEGCQVIVASGLGDAVRIADDKDNGLALLRVYGPRKFPALSFGPNANKTGDVTLTGIPDPKEQNDRKLTEIKARLVGGTAIELRQPVPMAGFSGAAALDGQGRFLGMMEMRNAVLASIEPSAPPVRLVTAQTIREFLDAHHVAASDAPSADAKASVVRMICVRK